MNQEKIMKRKMLIATAISVLLLITTFIFAGLYSDEKEKTQLAYKQQYLENMEQAYDELSTYLEKGKDYQQHYNMVLSDLGAARSLVFLLDDFSTDKQTTINELHYCFVKYPEQMEGKLEEAATAIEDITENLDKGYDEAQALVDSIDKMGK